MTRSPNGSEMLANDEDHVEKLKEKEKEKEAQKREYKRLGLSHRAKFGMSGAGRF